MGVVSAGLFVDMASLFVETAWMGGEDYRDDGD